VTLFASAFHLAPKGAWFPPFVETAIAASIVYMALENVVGPNLRRRWFITGMFGLVHGFGFADVLMQQLQFAGSYLLLSLFSFNVGIELGQMLVLAVMLPVLVLSRRLVPDRMLVIILSAIAAVVAGNWMIERYEVLRQQELPNLQDLLSLARWPALLLVVVGIGSVIVGWVKRSVAGTAPAGRQWRVLGSISGVAAAKRVKMVVSERFANLGKKPSPIIAVRDSSVERVEQQESLRG
jgi:hypothetical protein